MLKQDYANKVIGKIRVIYNIIDVDDIIRKSNKRIKMDTDHELTMVSVGRVCYEKGFERQLKLL